MSFINSGSIVVTSFNGILFCRYDAKIRQALKPSAQGPKSPPRSPPLPNQQFGVPLAVYVASAPSILFNLLDLFSAFYSGVVSWCFTDSMEHPRATGRKNCLMLIGPVQLISFFLCMNHPVKALSPSVIVNYLWHSY